MEVHVLASIVDFLLVELPVLLVANRPIEKLEFLVGVFGQICTSLPRATLDVSLVGC